MARLIYSAITSLDGYVADADGVFDWAAPDEELHAYVNERERPIGTYLYGRRMYDVMRIWAEPEFLIGQGAVVTDYARIWQAAEKVVYSTSLDAISTMRTRLERSFDPRAVRAMKAEATRDLNVGGADLAGQAIKAGLVDEVNLFLAPILVGGGKKALPDNVLVQLELVDERRFDSGSVHLCYRLVN
jgi:dihydrofolate reductase